MEGEGEKEGDGEGEGEGVGEGEWEGEGELEGEGEGKVKGVWPPGNWIVFTRVTPPAGRLVGPENCIWPEVVERSREGRRREERRGGGTMVLLRSTRAGFPRRLEFLLTGIF